MVNRNISRINDSSTETGFRHIKKIPLASLTDIQSLLCLSSPTEDGWMDEFIA